MPEKNDHDEPETHNKNASERSDADDASAERSGRGRTEKHRAEQDESRITRDNASPAPVQEENNPQSPASDDDQPITDAAAEQHDERFPIVCVGASAGGLEAMEAFFAELPAQSGLAVVVITHTAPQQHSMLPEIIKKKTRVAVRVIEDGMPVEVNTVYFPPTDRDPVVEKGFFQLKNRLSKAMPHMPIDLFCKSLANGRGERSGCVILSGTGTDGTQGVRMIKEKAGLVVAQDRSARHAGMPNSAIDTGLVDLVSNPSDMPRLLIDYFKYPATLRDRQQKDKKEPDQLQRILSVLASRTRHDFSLYKNSSVVRRIERRMTVTHCKDSTEYLKYLHHNPGESHALFQDLLIGVTNFFRDPEAFSFLKQSLLSELIARRNDGGSLRVWIPGCATGEEAFSVAIIIAECLEEKNVKRQVQIFATDIDSKAIEKARQGVYLQNIAADVSEERLKRFFKLEGDLYHVKSEIREPVVFAEQNVLRDPPFSNLDLLVCRNLLIYLKPDAQNKLLPLFHYTLKKEGILFLGASETVGRFPELFQPIHKSFSIYQKKDSIIRPQVEFPTAAMSNREPGRESQSELSTAPRKHETQNLSQAVEGLLLKEHTPACVIVNQRHEIVYVHGRTGKYLEPAQGGLSVKLTEMAREGLRFPLLSALRRAGEHKDQPVRYPGLSVKTNGGFQAIDLTVKCLSQPPMNDCIMVLFEDRLESENKPQVPHDAVADEHRIAGLENELMRVNQDYRAALEELEASNEELKSLNEEMHSSNEELQSTNEELESSREELQSVNEELSTVNSELHNKIRQLNESYTAVTHVLNSTRIALVFLDTEFKVQRFTQEATRLINLIDTDVGRPIDHVAHNLVFDNLGQTARKVLKNLSGFEGEVQTKGGSWYRMAIMVHRSDEHVIEGVVMTFINIDAQKMAQQDMEKMNQGQIASAKRFTDSIIDIVRESLLVLDTQMRVITANRRFYDTFKTRPEQTEGQSLFELGNRQWDIDKLKDLLGQIVNQDKIFEDYLVEHRFENIGVKRMLLSARQLREEQKDTNKVLLAIEDITGRDPSGGLS